MACSCPPLPRLLQSPGMDLSKIPPSKGSTAKLMLSNFRTFLVYEGTSDMLIILKSFLLSLPWKPPYNHSHFNLSPRLASHSWVPRRIGPSAGHWRWSVRAAWLRVPSESTLCLPRCHFQGMFVLLRKQAPNRCLKWKSVRSRLQTGGNKFREHIKPLWFLSGAYAPRIHTPLRSKKSQNSWEGETIW